MKKLEAVARETQQHLDDTRTLLHQAAAEAYIHAGDAELMNAIAGYLDTTSVVDAGSQLHVLGSFGTNEKDLLDQYLALQQRVQGQLTQIREVSDRAAAAVGKAETRVSDLRKSIDDARTQIAVSLAGIHDFETAATSATSPILGPSQLTAKQMADYIVAQHYSPRITVPIAVLAEFYLDEGARTGVRGDVAFAQSILETGGFANPGSAATDNNFAGIGWCDSCAHGFDFPDAAHRSARAAATAAHLRRSQVPRALLQGQDPALRLAEARVPRQGADVVGPLGHVGDGRARTASACTTSTNGWSRSRASTRPSRRGKTASPAGKGAPPPTGVPVAGKKP